MAPSAQTLPATAADDLPDPEVERLAAALAQAVGVEGVRTDAAARRLFSQDIWSVAEDTVALIVAPDSLDALRRAVALVNEAAFAIAPRGSGMSYTGAYLPTGPRTVSLDLSRMDRVLDVDAEDMTVTVEAGCTWAALNAVLEPKGLRTPFWGPMSGLVSTVGGGLSQLNAMFGAGQYGTSSESVVGLAVVLADGQVLRAGARKADGAAFYRHYGPDLAGLFCGDGGAFGIKAEITLRLIRRPEHEGFGSFAFPTAEGVLRAMAEVARAGVAAETCGFDPGLTRVRMKRAGLAADVKVLGAVIGREKSLGKGLLSAARIAIGGRNFLEEDVYSLHLICEGRSKAGVEADLQTARRIAHANGGVDIETTIAKVLRAVPFPPLNSVIGPQGERWAPVHGLAALSQAVPVFEALQALFAEMAGAFEKAGVYTGYLLTTLSTNALIIEPVFYWPDTRHPLIDTIPEAEHMARLPAMAANPAATAVVAEARRRAVEIFASHGCGHFQIGRTYPYRASRDPASAALLDSLKAALDPAGTMNPGVLGFPAPARP